MRDGQFYGGYRNLVNSISNSNVSNFKKSNLKSVQNRMVSTQKDTNTNEADIINISKVLSSVLTALKNTDIEKTSYAAAREVANSYSGGKGKSTRQLQGEVDNLRDILNTLFTSLDVNLNKTEADISDYYSRHGISSGGLTGGSINKEQLKELNDIYSSHLNNVPAAWTALSNLLTILPNLRGGKTWKYKSPKTLSRGFTGFVSNIVGSLYEKKFHDMISNLNKTNKVLDIENIESQLIGGKNNKSEITMQIAPGGGKLEVIEKKLAKLSLKSYKITRQNGVSLHGTTANAISKNWKQKGKVASSPNASRIIAMANARGLLKVAKDTMKIDGKKFDRDFGGTGKTQVQSNLMKILKNTMYFNADMFFKKDIVYLIGKSQYMSSEEFISRLINDSNALRTQISGGTDNPRMRIVAHLAAEGRK